MSDTPINQEPLESAAAQPSPQPSPEPPSGPASPSTPEHSPESASAPSPELPPEAAPEPHRTGLPDQKKNALLRYMAILFGVAFLLVLLSFLIQMRDSRETISDLSESGQRPAKRPGAPG